MICLDNSTGSTTSIQIIKKWVLCMLASDKTDHGSISQEKVGQNREHTEEDTLPPIQHVQPKSDIVKVDLPLYPIHDYRKPTSKEQPPSQLQSKISGHGSMGKRMMKQEVMAVKRSNNK